MSQSLSPVRSAACSTRRAGMRRFAAAAVVVSGLLAASPAAAAEPGHYTVHARIEPASGAMQVTLDMRLPPQGGTRELAFLLHRDLTVESVQGDALETFSTAHYEWPGAPHLQHIQQVSLGLRESAADEPIVLRWRYGGELRDDHLEMGQAAMTAHWMELPAEALWVPMNPDPANGQYTWNATVELPDGYTLVTAGHESRDGERWELASTEPSLDLPLIASDRMQQRTATVEGGVTVTVHHAGSDPSLVDYVARHATDIVERYSERFGTGLHAPELDIALSPLPRETAHSYARPGLIGLSNGIDEGPRLLQLVAHEAAHLWWMKSSDAWSRHNFLNESFAEFFAWGELARVYGQEHYDERVAKARESARDAPGFDEWTQQTNGVLSYVKGPLLLHDLHARIGADTFDRIARALQARRVGTLEGMLDTLEEVAGADAAAWMRDAL